MTPQEMKQKLDKLKSKAQQLKQEIEQLENDYAQAACPWRKNTVLQDEKDGKFYVVDHPIFYRDDWAVVCTRIKKDGTFGVYTETIHADYAGWYRVVKGARLTDVGMVKSTEQKLSEWNKAAKSTNESGPA